VLPLLWALASRKAVRLLRPGEEEKLPVLAQAVLSFVLVVFAWMNFAAVYMPSLNNSESLVRLAAVAGALMLLALSSLLMGVGWSWPAMRTGLAWGLGLALVIFTLSAGYRASGLDEKPHMELWQGRNTPQNAALIEDTIGDAAMWQNGLRSVTDVTVIGFTSPALDWALRGVRDVTHEPFLPVEANPSVVITPLQDELALINSYRGQDFTWTAEVDWPSMTLENGFAWLLARQAPELPTNIIVWVRADLFAGSAGQPADQPAPLAPAE